MSGRKGEIVTYHLLDPADGRALLQAVDRLPAQALGRDTDPLTPSLRSVLDRFLSVPLRGILRSLGPVDGPAAVVVDGLTVDDGPGRTGATEAADGGGRPGLAPALVTWLVEAAGLFVVDHAGGRRTTADHRLLLTHSRPPTEAPPVRLAPLDGAIDRIDHHAWELLITPRYRAAGAPVDDTSTVAPLIGGRAPATALTAAPDTVIGIEPAAEAARLQLLDALSAVEIEIPERPGRLVLVDERRGPILDPDRAHPTAAEPVPWRDEVALVADPRAETIREQ